MKKHLLLNYILMIFIFITCKMNANETIIINTNQFIIDHTNKIVLTNMDVNSINTTWPGTKNSIQLNEIWNFVIPVENVQIGAPYLISTIAHNSSYLLYFTELPLISITTPNTIINEPDVWANFKMIEKDQTFLESNIGIQYRGSYSQSLPKKSMEIKFWTDSLGSDTQDHTLLNMVNSDSWNLQAMANEPLRIRSKTNFDLWRMINELHYINSEPDAINGVRMNYIELFINNEYRGVYCLGEKVKRKQLKLKKHNGSIRGELYKGDNWGNTTFTSLPPFNNSSDVWDGFEYKHPDEEINWQNLYNLCDFVINSSNTNFYQNYSSKFDVNNLVDYYIFLNLLRAADNTGKNIYIAKYDTNSPYFYVPWDLDGTFGTSWTGEKDDITNDILSNGLYQRLINDCNENGFREKLKTKWLALRENTITHSAIMNMFITNHNLLNTNGIYQRESARWDDYNYSIQDIAYMSSWLTNRLEYLDDFFTRDCPTSSTENPIKADLRFSLYPNPTTSLLNIETENESNFKIEIFNNLGQIVISENSNENHKVINVSNLSNGIYMVRIKTENKEELHKIIVKK